MNGRIKTILLAMLLIALPLCIFAGEDADNEGDTTTRKQRRPGLPDRSSDRRPGRNRMHHPEITEQQETELLEAIKKHRPEIYEKIIHLKESKSPAYKHGLARMWMWYQKIKSMPEDVRESAITEWDTRLKIGRLLGQIRNTENDTEKEKLQSELRTLIAKKFDASMKMNEYRLKMLEEKIKSLKTELKQRASDRDKIIDQEVEQYLQGHKNEPRPFKKKGGRKHHTENKMF